MFSVQILLDRHSELFSPIMGSFNKPLEAILPPDRANDRSLCFVQKEADFNLAVAKGCTSIAIDEKLASETLKASLENLNLTIISFKNFQLALAHSLRFFDNHLKALAHSHGVSPHAQIHPTAKLGKNVTIAPFTQIGANSVIGENSIIGPNCTIEAGVKIGTDTHLQSHVFVGYDCEIGSHCTIKPFATVGSSGYGFAPTKTDILKIPQVGITIIEDYVEIGANTCIDRATLTETRIGKGTKIDNIVHIAHNCVVGKYCLITAGFATAGSSIFGDHFICGGQVSVADHIEICSNVTLAGASVVTNDIIEPGAYGGSPLQPMTDYLKTKASLAHVPKLRKQMTKILKHLGISED